MTVPSVSAPATTGSSSPPTRSTEFLMGAMEGDDDHSSLEDGDGEELPPGDCRIQHGGIWLGARLKIRSASQMSSVASRGPASVGTENEAGAKHRNNRTTTPPTTTATSNNQTPGADSPPASPAGSDRGARACCFCWCCCCSCSWEHVRDLNSLTVKNSEDSRKPDTRLEPLKEEQPTLEEIRSWSDTFDKLMSSSGGRKIFREFLRSEYSEENMLFWLACEELKTEQNAEVVEEKARIIYEDYISILSPREVSLDSRVREVINRNMVDPTPRTFDEAQLQIYTLMNRDSYPRFVNSQLYKRLLQQAS